MANADQPQQDAALRPKSLREWVRLHKVGPVPVELLRWTHGVTKLELVTRDGADALREVDLISEWWPSHITGVDHLLQQFLPLGWASSKVVLNFASKFGLLYLSADGVPWAASGYEPTVDRVRDYQRYARLAAATIRLARSIAFARHDVVPVWQSDLDLVQAHYVWGLERDGDHNAHPPFRRKGQVDMAYPPFGFGTRVIQVKTAVMNVVNWWIQSSPPVMRLGFGNDGGWDSYTDTGSAWGAIALQLRWVVAQRPYSLTCANCGALLTDRQRHHRGKALFCNKPECRRVQWKFYNDRRAERTRTRKRAAAK